MKGTGNRFRQAWVDRNFVFFRPRELAEWPNASGPSLGLSVHPSFGETVHDDHRILGRKVPRVMIAVQNLFQWFTQNPLGAATVLYVTGIVGVLIYVYFEPQEQH